MPYDVEPSMASVSTDPPRNTILSLPPEIRCQIYRHAGLALEARILLPSPTKSPIEAQMSMLPPPWRAIARKEKLLFDLEDLQMSRNLVLTCKLFYTEVSALFYSKNYFIFKPDNVTDFSSLLRLGLNCIAHLKHLAVLLNVTSCHPFVSEASRVDMIGENASTKALKNRSKRQELVPPDLLADWPAAISHILTNATINHLKLYLTCDTDSFEQAHTVIKPLNGVGPLADCAVRFNARWDPALSSLAEKVVRSVTGQTLLRDDQIFFRYLDLPVEVRYNVLENTDLVVPGKQVTWNPHDRYYVKRITKNWLKTNSDCYSNYGQRPANSRKIKGCYCLRFHSAFKFRCRCWRPPKSMFLVCRMMRHDAEAVFFSKNRIIIMPVEGSQIVPKRNNHSMDASVFFRTAIRSSAIRHLRHLDIVFPPFEEMYCPPKLVLPDWKDTIAHLQRESLHSALEISVYMQGRQLYQKASRFGVIVDEKAKAIASTQLRILEPFAELVEIKRLFLHIGNPYARTVDEIEQRKIDPTHEARAYDKWQEEIRKKVLGNDYERLNRDVDDKSRGRWRKVEPVTYRPNQYPW